MALLQRKRRRRREFSSLQILEEAFHLLRTSPPSFLLTYYLGAIPFVALAMYFVADMSSSSFAERDAVEIALWMTAAFFWMKYCQAKFAAKLLDRITPGHIPVRKGWQKFRYVSALFLLQVFHLPMLILGAFFAIPFGWIIAAWQNMTVLAFTTNYDRKPFRGLVHQSLKNSHYEWAQNHGILMILGFVSLFLWINFVSACFVLATFGKTFFGTDSLFTTNPGAAIFNTTYLSGTLLIVYLVISPVMKAVYLLRCFYADSRSTGADLLSRLGECESKREKEDSRARVRLDKVALIALTFFLIAPTQATAQDSEAVGANADSAETAGDMQSAIRDTMQQKKYQWRLSRKEMEDSENEDKSWIARQMTSIADSFEAFWKKQRDRFREWERKMEERRKKNERKNSGSKGSGIGFDGIAGLQPVASIGLMLLVGGAIIWLLVVLVRHYKSSAPIEFDDSRSSGPIDLESEDIVASQLPEDEWMKLAREQIAKGDTRLAIRALFLASLAHLGEHGLLKIARFKSNRDYNRELELRARHRDKLREAFGENTGLFERAWYGLHLLGEETVEHFMANYEKISNDTRAAEGGPAA